MQLWPAKANAVCGELGRHVLDVGVGLHEHRGRVAELERDLLLRRPLAELPADAARAGEGDQAHALVAHEDVADLGGGADEDVQPPGRSPASSSISASRSAESGVWPAGFSTTAQPAASAGAILCATRLSGKLKG